MSEDQIAKQIRQINYADAVQGKELYNFFGNRVLEHTTSTGAVLAIKINPCRGLDRAEGDMMHYAATNGVLAPRVRGTYDIVTTKPIARALVSDRVPGQPLADIWHDLDDARRSDIKAQLRVQLARMRACTQPYIGRIGCLPTQNVYDLIPTTHCGPFASEKAFDEWCLARVRGTPFTRWKWKRVLERARRDSPATFVLTHGDLTPLNILVQDGVVTGIVDWATSGFFPEYAEYAFAMALCRPHDEWWISVLKDVLEPCSAERLRFTRLVEDRGFE